jgi:hypothetical protein
MMTRFFRYTAIFIALALWLGGCFQEMLQVYYKTGIVPDDYRYGDLYRLSNLPQFRDPVERCAPPAAVSDTARTDLYLIGDSFTEPGRLTRADLSIAQRTHTHWDATPLQVQLNPAHRNVLVLETVERHLREHLHKSINQFAVVADTNPPPLSMVPGLGASLSSMVSATSSRVSDLLRRSRQKPETRLEVVLFGHEPFLWIKEWKAAMNQRLFGRVDPQVRLSPDGRHLLYYLDSDSTGTTSDFVPVADTEVTAMVDSLNRARERYMKLGFSEVYLAVIPNKTTILAPTLGRYNHLIERLEGQPALRLPVVSVYKSFQSARVPIYALGDSHWNCTGRAIWLREVRDRLGI